jgi:hypothetical protein
LILLVLDLVARVLGWMVLVAIIVLSGLLLLYRLKGYDADVDVRLRATLTKSFANIDWRTPRQVWRDRRGVRRLQNQVREFIRERGDGR